VLDWRLGQIPGKLDRVLDVASLGGLVAARQEDDQLSTPLREVHAVAGADIDLEFGHALAKDAMRAGIAVDEPIHANLDPGAGDMVPQAIDPVPVDGRHPDAHGHTVSHRRRKSTVSVSPWHRPAKVEHRGNGGEGPSQRTQEPRVSAFPGVTTVAPQERIPEE